jgi:predicted helicase
MNDLLFISAYGDTDGRQMTFAHFCEPSVDRQDVRPTLRVLGWDGDDTRLKVDQVAKTLHEKLAWPDDEHDFDSWRQRWSEAFVLRPREVIRTAGELAVRLADLARAIRNCANTVLQIESSAGPLRKLHQAFQAALIHDLSADDFADLFAQAVTYGLFSAAVSPRPSGSTAAVAQGSLTEMLPKTSPFLRDILATFLRAGGRQGKIDFDELGIQEVVDLLNSPDTHLDAILLDFGNRTRQEDPVIHFYEHFLSEYDKVRKIQRGVFYTPQPVVSYIVRSVHEMLQTEFGLDDGLASTVTWGEIAAKHAGLKVPAGVNPTEPFVQILDPATGTATFLVEVIDVIYLTLTAKWKQQRLSDAEQRAAWNAYVPKHLLSRLHGYELLMAPYAIAHMKIGLKLYETGYRFGSDERARIYLTNTLEPASDEKKQREFEEWAPALAHEAHAVNAVKKHQRFTVVIGNPPYAGISSNMSPDAQQIVDAYKFVDGHPLNERKLWLQDDYVKFIRTAQLIIEQANTGILGYITNHGYFDNPTFRGMRQSLMGTFPHLRVLDLHGNANKKEQAPDGSEDKNVFDIRQGVGICLGTRTVAKPSVQHADLWGTREAKYDWLDIHSVANTPFTALLPDSPYYFLKPQNTDTRAEYDEGWKITDAMPVNSAGFITARDHFVVDFDRDNLLARLADFANPRVSDAEIRRKYFAGCGSDKYPDGDTRGWKVPEARRSVEKDKKWRERIQRCLYRPFDTRYVYWAEWMVDWPRPEVMGQMLAGPNHSILTARSNKASGTDHFFCSKWISETKCAEYSTQSAVFPLYTFRDAAGGQGSFALGTQRRSNFSAGFLRALANALGVTQVKPHGLPEGITPEDIFQYAYGVFHSPGYRSRYAEFLKSDFPRLPLTGNLDMFHSLAKLGGELAALHLLESPKLDKPVAPYTGPANPEVEKVSHARNTVWLDKAQTRGFSNIPETVWQFHIGGYQVCDKWLKDRKGCKLSKSDIVHYQKIVVALRETIRIMTEIDKVIDAHGGWPGAFVIEKSKARKAGHQ